MVSFIESVNFCFVCYFKSQDEEYLDILLDEEIQNTEKRLKETFENEQKEKQLKKKNKELLLDELVSYFKVSLIFHLFEMRLLFYKC